jgi:hypothetical protein
MCKSAKMQFFQRTMGYKFRGIIKGTKGLINQLDGDKTNLTRTVRTPRPFASKLVYS